MPDNHIEAPIMPTGSGVADLEVAREQDALASAGVDQVMPAGQAPIDEAASGSQADAVAESQAHPS